MHEDTLYKLRPVMGSEHPKAAKPGYIPVPTLYVKKAQRWHSKARTCLRIIGGLSWIAGLCVLAVVAAGIEQDKLSGWQLIVSAVVGLGLLGLTVVVSNQERSESDGENQL